MDPKDEETKKEFPASTEEEIFSEVPLFEATESGSGETGDCGCFNCDGNPCQKSPS